jgi:hypothetical protein
VKLEDDLPRKPDSSATEKNELSALKEADRAEGPEEESRTCLVFILVVGGSRVEAQANAQVSGYLQRMEIVER